MPRIAITHAVQDIDRWLGGRAERAAWLPDGVGATELLAMDGSRQVCASFRVDDVDAFKHMLAEMPPEAAAQAESHGVILPMTFFVEAE